MNMKMYNRPEIFVTEFEMNSAVAVCDRLPTGDYEYSVTTVQCLATQSDVIFNDADIGCKHVVDPANNGTDYAWFQDTKSEYSVVPDDQVYFGWVSDEGGMPEPENQTLFDTLHTIFDNLLSGSGKIHFGPVNDYLKQLYSHST